jgi:methylmalonyl-CoA mutase N-terminal domain/subunit
MLRFHTQTAGATLTAQEPDNNAVRVALQALAAVLGGTQSLHTNSRDEALALPTEEAVKLALRTQQIIAYESNIPHAVDPLGGSYYIESLTNRIEKEVHAYLAEIEKMGGAMAAIEGGYFQQEIHRSAYEYQKAIENGAVSVIGVNQFVTEKKRKKLLTLKVSPQAVRKQITRLRKVKRQRNNRACKTALTKLKKAARNSSNLMSPILDCVRLYATIGEISDTLRDVYGEYKETRMF